MKAQEAHKLSDEEIKVELQRLRRHIFDLKSQAVTQKLEDPTLLRKTRRDVARLMTEQHSRTLKSQSKADSSKAKVKA